MGNALKNISVKNKASKIFTGSSCNNNCIFCSTINDKIDKKTSSIKQDILNTYNSGSDSISFSGGEFLIRKDALELIKYTKTLDFKTININTNCIALSYYDYLETIIKSGANSFVVLINANNSSLHDFTTKNVGSFKKLKSGIENLNKAKKKYNICIKAKIIFTEQNYKSLHKIGEFILKNKIESCELILVKPLGEGFDKYKSLCPKIIDTLPYIRRFLELGRKRFFNDWKISGVPYCLLMGYSDMIKTDDSFFNPQNNLCKKTKKCKDCFYFNKCFGLSKTYDAIYGDGELNNINFIPEMKKYLLIRPSINEPLLPLNELLSSRNPGFAIRNMQASGLLKISNYLKSRGNHVMMIDCLKDLEVGGSTRKNVLKKRMLVEYVKCGNFENENVSIPKYLFGYSKKKLFSKLKNLKTKFIPDEIFISTAMTYYFETVYDAVDVCKHVFKNSKVTLGGIYATLCKEHAKLSGADVVHSGEFSLANDFPTDLDVLSYTPNYAIIKSTRGCPNNCSYCAVSLLEGRKMRYRNIDSVMEDILEKYHAYGIKHFVFFESNILLNMDKHFIVLLDRIIESKIKIVLTCPEGFEINKVTYELALKLKKVGFININLALESVDDDVLKRFNKPIKSINLQDAVINLKKAGFKNTEISVFILVGLMDQSLDSIVKSYSYVWKNECSITFMPFTPIPGTDEYKKYETLIKDKSLDELHPILLSCANENLKLKDLYELSLFKHTLSPLDPFPMLFYLMSINPRSRVVDLIIKYHYDGDYKKIKDEYKKYNFSRTEKEKLNEAKLFFDKFYTGLKEN